MLAWKYDVSRDAVAELLRGGGEFNEAERLLSDLSPEQATTAIDGAPYTIAILVAHLLWNLQQNLVDIGIAGPPSLIVSHIDDSFPDVSATEWLVLRATFLATLEQIKHLSPDTMEQSSRVNDETSVGYDFAEMALHNAYHFGQIVLLRRMMGLWPPLGGDNNLW